MLTSKDLTLYPPDKATKKAVRECSAVIIRNLVKSWLDTPELQPVNPSCTYEKYVGLVTRQAQQELSIDWSNGFCEIQLAQMEVKSIITDTNPRRKWKVFRAVKEGRGKLNMDIDKKTFETSFKNTLAQTFDCHYHTLHDKRTDLVWMRIHIIADYNAINPYPSRKVAFLVYCPHTEFVMLSGATLPLNLESYIREAILDIFNADNILMQKVHGHAALHLAAVVKTRKSQGVFSELRANLNYTNPLNIRQTSKLGDTETYVDPGEQSRRIKALNKEEIDARLKSLIENFGGDESFGKTNLVLDVSMPMQFSEEEDRESGQPISFEITLKGNNIANGLRNMIKSGQIKAPVPKWLEMAGSSNLSRIFITENGASDSPDGPAQENPSDQDEEDDEEREGQEDQSESKNEVEENDHSFAGDKSIVDPYSNSDLDMVIDIKHAE